MKTVAICQARMGSTRLPGKVMSLLNGYPMLYWTWRAAMLAPGVDQAVIATSTLPADDPIAEFCLEKHIPVYRGSHDDVLARFVGAARQFRANVVLRLTCDCPLLDSTVIGEVVALRKATGVAYASNIYPPTWPDGLDTEIFTIEALLAAEAEATRLIDRDNVSNWIYRNRSRFPAENLVCPIPGLHKERWVCDTAEDMTFVRNLLAHTGLPARYLNVLAALERHPELRKFNENAGPRNERFYDALTKEDPIPKTRTRSQAANERAQDIIPFGAQTFSKSRLSWPAPLFLSHGQGGLAYDLDGHEYVDLVGALLPNILGYCDPDVDVALRRQIGAGISFSAPTELEAQLSGTLSRLIPCAEMVKFGKSGTDVTTAAVRVARAFTGRDEILICGGYHGWADWSTERNYGVPVDVRLLSMRIPLGDFDRANEFIRSRKFAAVIVEPETNHRFLGELRLLCDATDTVLIFDEVITGFRWHLGGAQALFSVTPDLATFGKAMGNGMPISALVGRSDIMNRFAPGDQPNAFYSGTMFGETLSIAAAIATIDKLERENVVDRVRNKTANLAAWIRTTIEERGLERDIMLDGSRLARLTFHHHPTATATEIRSFFIREMMDAGVLILNAHALCHAHSASDIARVFKAYDIAFDALADALHAGDLSKRIAGESLSPPVREAQHA